MARLGVPLRAVALAALMHTLSSSAASVPASSLFGRADATCASGYSYCSGANLPNYFCCPSASSCQVLAANTTVVCCPSNGGTCNSIEPISCLLDQEDGQAHPAAVVKTTALTGALPTCGGACCPFGYSCSDNVCVKNANQDAAPSTNAAPTSASSSSSSVSSSTTTTPLTSSASNGNSVSASNASTTSSPSSSGLSAGATVGLCIAAVLAIFAIAFIVWWIQRRKKTNKTSPVGSSGGVTPSSTKPKISRPMGKDNDLDTTRLDFSRLYVPPDVSKLMPNSGLSQPDSLAEVAKHASSLDGLVAGAGGGSHSQQLTPGATNLPLQHSPQHSPPPPQGSPDQKGSHEDWESAYKDWMHELPNSDSNSLLTPSPLRPGKNTLSPDQSSQPTGSWVDLSAPPTGQTRPRLQSDATSFNFDIFYRASHMTQWPTPDPMPDPDTRLAR